MGGWCRAGPGAGGKGVTGSREGRVNMQPEAGWDPMCPGSGVLGTLNISWCWTLESKREI